MAVCRIHACGHSVKRNADSKMLGWSWNIYGICVCCANELSAMGTVLERAMTGKSIGCIKQLELEILYPNKPKMVRNRIG